MEISIARNMNEKKKDKHTVSLTLTKGKQIVTDLEILRKKRTQVLLVWKTRLVIESYYFKLM